MAAGNADENLPMFHESVGTMRERHRLEKQLLFAREGVDVENEQIR